MDIYRCTEDESTDIDRNGSIGASHVKLAHSTGEAHLNMVYVQAGGGLRAHEAPVPQLFVVVAGEGWVSGGDGNARAVRAGDAVLWREGEMHESGTESGMTAVVLQARELIVDADGAIG